MNKKRFAAALLALVLCVSVMTACSPSAAPGGVTPEPTTAPTATPSSVVEATPETTAEPTATPSSVVEATPEPHDGSETTVVSTVPAAPQKNGLYDALCDLFNNYHPGTAGSSLTGARIAATIVDFSIENGLDAVRSGATAFDLGEETEFGEKLTDKLTMMYETAMGLYGESGKSLLTDGGYTPTNFPYSAKDVRDAYTAIFTERGYEVPAVVRIYRSDANAESFLAFGFALDGTEITADTLNGAMDGLVFENGAAFNTVAVDENGHIKADMNEAFAVQLRSLGTTGEYFLVGGIVNTLLDAFDGTDVMLTVNGAPLESGHAVYDTALTRYEE